MTDQDLLAVYLNDHLAASTAGVELARRAAKSHDGERGEELSRLADEIAEDREALRDLMKRLDVSESTVKAAAGWLGDAYAPPQLLVEPALHLRGGRVGRQDSRRGAVGVTERDVVQRPVRRLAGLGRGAGQDWPRGIQFRFRGADPTAQHK